MPQTMPEAVKEMFRSLPRTPKPRCLVCRRPQAYTNPIATCYECRKKFCFDHILGTQVRAGMGEGESARDVCAPCGKEKKYFDVERAIVNEGFVLLT